MHKSEKKFLLNGDIKSLVADLEKKAVEYHIFFSKIKLCKEIKYQKKGRKYTKTIRSGVGYAQSKRIFKITEEEFARAEKKRIAKKLRIKRYKIDINECKLFIYLYQDDNEGVNILKIPKNCSSNSGTITQNEFIKPYVEKEITDDPRYENRHLALFGDPLKHPYNIYAIFKDMENSRLESAQKTLFREMKTSESVRIILFHLLKETEKATAVLIKKPDNEKMLRSYRKNIKLSKFILSEYENIFEERMYQKIFTHINKLLRITKTQKDLMLIHKKFQMINRELKSEYLDILLKNLTKKLSEENIKISKYFKTREYAIIHRQYELFIRENNKSFLSYDAQIAIGYSATMKFNSIFEKLKRLCEKYDSCNDDKSYEKMEKSFFRFEQFIYSFREVIDIKTLPVIHKKSKKLYKMLKKCHNLSKSFLILKMLEDQNDKISTNEKEKLKILRSKLREKKMALDEKIAIGLQNFTRLESGNKTQK